MAEQQNLDPVDPSVQPENDLEMVLEEYRRRQMVEHLTGPVVSVVLHLVVLIVCFIFMVEKPPPPITVVEFKATDMQVKEIEKLDQKIEKQVEKMDEVVPTVERPDVSEAASAAPGEAGGSVGDFNDNMPSTADGGDTDTVLDVKMSNSPIRIAGIYGGRTNAGRKGALGRFGPGGPNGGGTELSVLKALRWLKEHQNSDGSWSQSQKVGMCGLALLCYLAHGELANSKEFGPTVERAMKFLVDRMDQTGDGEMIKGTDAHGYSHAIAVYALAEAYGMTKLPYLKGPMEKGLATMINGQESCGGWDYKFNKSSSRWDLSISGWTMQALKAGFLAGSDNSQLGEVLQKSATFVQKTTYANGRFGYSSPGHENGNYHMTGVGTLCLQLLGQKDCAEAQAGIKTIKEKVTVQWRDPERKSSGVVSFEPYGWYYHTQAMFYNGMSTWPSWNKMFSKELVRAQDADGHWDAPPPVGGGKSTVGEMEPYYSTTLCCLMLEVYYRFLPSYKMDLKEKHSDGATKLELE